MVLCVLYIVTCMHVYAHSLTASSPSFPLTFPSLPSSPSLPSPQLSTPPQYSPSDGSPQWRPSIPISVTPLRLVTPPASEDMPKTLDPEYVRGTSQLTPRGKMQVYTWPWDMVRKKAKQRKATQHNLPNAVIFQRRISYLGWDSNPQPSAFNVWCTWLWVRVPPEAANFLWKMTLSGKLCCVALPFRCVIVVVAFLGIS